MRKNKEKVFLWILRREINFCNIAVGFVVVSSLAVAAWFYLKLLRPLSPLPLGHAYRGRLRSKKRERKICSRFKNIAKKMFTKLT